MLPGDRNRAPKCACRRPLASNIPGWHSVTPCGCPPPHSFDWNPIGISPPVFFFSFPLPAAFPCACAARRTGVRDRGCVGMRGARIF